MIKLDYIGNGITYWKLFTDHCSVINFQNWFTNNELLWYKIEIYIWDIHFIFCYLM